MKEYRNLQLETGLVREENKTLNIPFTLVALAFSAFVVSTQLYLTIPAYELISKSLGISKNDATWLTSLYSFGYALGFLVSGPLSDRFGRRKVMVSSLVILAIITFLVATSSSFKILLGLRFIQGIAAAAYAPAALAYAGEMFPSHFRPTAIVALSTSFLMAGIAGQLYAGWVSAVYGWQMVFWMVGLIYLLAALSVFMLTPDTLPNSGIRLWHVYRAIGTHLRSLPLIAVFAADLTIIFGFVSLYSGLGSFYDSQDLMLIRVAGVPGILLSLSAARLIKRWGNRKVVAGGFTLAVLGLVLVTLSLNLWMTTVASFIFAAGIALALPGLISLVGLFAKTGRGAAVSLHSFMLFAGGSVGPLFVATLLPSGMVVISMALALILILGSLVVVWGTATA